MNIPTYLIVYSDSRFMGVLYRQDALLCYGLGLLQGIRASRAGCCHALLSVCPPRMGKENGEALVGREEHCPYRSTSLSYCTVYYLQSIAYLLK